MSVFCYAKAGGEAYISSGNVETVRAYGNVQLSSANIGNFYTYAGGRGHATTGTTTIRGLLALGEGSSRYSSYSFFYVYQNANLKVNGTTYINPRSKLRMNANSYTTFGGDIYMYCPDGADRNYDCGNMCAYDKYSGASYSTRCYGFGQEIEKGMHMFYLNAGDNPW